MKLIVHLGLHRTGSTSLQHWLEKAAPRLNAAGIAVASGSSASAAQASLTVLLQEVADHVGRDAAFAAADAMFDEMAATWASAVISDENLLGAMPVPDCGAFSSLPFLTKMLQHLGRNHEVITMIVLREHVDWLQSIHHFRSASTPAYANFRTFMDGFPGEPIAFRPMLEAVEAAAGKGRLMVHSYDKVRDDGGRALLADLLAGLGADAEAGDVLPHVNASMAGPIDRLLRLTEQHGVAPAIGNASVFAQKLERQLETGSAGEAIGWLAQRIRNKSVPVSSGLGPRQRLRAANLAFKALGRRANDLTPQQARAIARDVVSGCSAPDIPAGLLAEWRQRFAADRAWVADRFLPEWRGSAGA